MKRKIYRSSATLLLGSFFIFGLSGCSPALNSSAWFPSWGQEEGYFAARKARQEIEPIYRLACRYQEKNQHQMALEEFKRVLRLNPNHVQSYNGMGISYDRLGNYSRAIGCYTAALKINPDLDYLHNNMGYSYLLQGQAGQAVTAFQKAVALNPTNDRYRNNLGVAYAQMGKVHLAMAEFKSTEKDSPAPAAPSALDKPETRQAADQQAGEQVSVVVPTLAADLESSPATVETGSGTIASLPIGVEPAPPVVEKIQPQAAAIMAVQFDVEKAKPMPVQAAVVEDNPVVEKVKPVPVQAVVEDKPRTAEKIHAAPVQTVAAAPVPAPVAQLSGPAKSAPPVMAKPLSTGAQARHSEKQVVETLKTLEPRGITAVPREKTILARADARSAQTIPAQQEKIAPVQAAPAQQMFIFHQAGVEVANGTGGKGMATWWGKHLWQQGVPVTSFTTADSNYSKTKIYYCEGYLQEAYQLAKKIPLYQNFERVTAFEDSQIKIRVVIGRDVQRFARKDAEKIIVARAEI